MHVNKWMVLVTVAACGAGKSPTTPTTHDDAGAHGDDAGSGSGAPTQTDVTGVIAGTSFELRYSAVSWSPPGDPRIWVCAANIPITYSQCMQSGGSSRVMLFGPFTYDQAGAPRWDLAELFQYQVGGTAVTELARSATITVYEDDASANHLKLAFSIDFGGAQPTRGTVDSP